MLATSVFYPQHVYTPARSSPLAERSVNAAPYSPFNFSMASSEKKPPEPQRVFKPNPVLQTRDVAMQRRRDMFFRRVQRDRDDRKWDARGEQIQRLDYISERRRWEAEKERQSPQLADDTIEEEFTEAMSSARQLEVDVDEAEYMLQQEEHELQQLIASMEEREDVASQHYGSDDEDYDNIFLQCASDENLQPSSQSNQPHSFLQVDNSIDDRDAMDMTEG